jgi:hypothetical protein
MENILYRIIGMNGDTRRDNMGRGYTTKRKKMLFFKRFTIRLFRNHNNIQKLILQRTILYYTMCRNTV